MLAVTSDSIFGHDLQISSNILQVLQPFSIFFLYNWCYFYIDMEVGHYDTLG